MKPSVHALEAQAWFAELRLELPPIPVELARAMIKLHDCCFSTRSLPISPYNFDWYITELAWRDVSDYAVVAHAGHGINSYALAFYILREPYAVLLHVAFGGVYMSSEATERAKEYFAKTSTLIRSLEEKRSSLPRKRILVAASFPYNIGAFHPGLTLRREGTPPRLSSRTNLRREQTLQEAGVSIESSPDRVLNDALAWCAAL